MPTKVARRESLFRSIVCTGKFFGEPVAMKFISKVEWDLIPETARPPAMREESGEWFAILEVKAPGPA